jgi:toxin YoeB
MYDMFFSKRAEKEAVIAARSGLWGKVEEIIKTVCLDPYDNSNNFKALKHDLKGYYSRRIDKQNRFVYEILPTVEGLADEGGKLFDGIIRVVSMWDHC